MSISKKVSLDGVIGQILAYGAGLSILAGAASAKVTDELKLPPNLHHDVRVQTNYGQNALETQKAAGMENLRFDSDAYATPNSNVWVRGTYSQDPMISAANAYLTQFFDGKKPTNNQAISTLAFLVESMECGAFEDRGNSMNLQRQRGQNPHFSSSNNLYILDDSDLSGVGKKYTGEGYYCIFDFDEKTGRFDNVDITFYDGKNGSIVPLGITTHGYNPSGRFQLFVENNNSDEIINYMMRQMDGSGREQNPPVDSPAKPNNNPSVPNSLPYFTNDHAVANVSELIAAGNSDDEQVVLGRYHAVDPENDRIVPANLSTTSSTPLMDTRVLKDIKYRWVINEQGESVLQLYTSQENLSEGLSQLGPLTGIEYVASINDGHHINPAMYPLTLSLINAGDDKKYSDNSNLAQLALGECEVGAYGFARDSRNGPTAMEYRGLGLEGHCVLPLAGPDGKLYLVLDGNAKSGGQQTFVNGEHAADFKAGTAEGSALLAAQAGALFAGAGVRGDYGRARLLGPDVPNDTHNEGGFGGKAILRYVIDGKNIDWVIGADTEYDLAGFSDGQRTDERNRESVVGSITADAGKIRAGINYSVRNTDDQRFDIKNGQFSVPLEMTLGEDWAVRVIPSVYSHTGVDKGRGVQAGIVYRPKK